MSRAVNLEQAALICDAVVRAPAPTVRDSAAGVRAARATMLAVGRMDLVEAFDRAVLSAYKSGAATCAHRIRTEAERHR